MGFWYALVLAMLLHTVASMTEEQFRRSMFPVLAGYTIARVMWWTAVMWSLLSLIRVVRWQGWSRTRKEMARVKDDRQLDLFS